MKLTYKGVVFDIITDVGTFNRKRDNPFDKITTDYLINLDTKEKCYSTGYCMLNTNVVTLLILPNCQFMDLLETISHELGHLIIGGYTYNPPDVEQYYAEHEKKAEHYQNFVLDAYAVTLKVIDKLKKIHPANNFKFNKKEYLNY